MRKYMQHRNAQAVGSPHNILLMTDNSPDPMGNAYGLLLDNVAKEAGFTPKISSSWAAYCKTMRDPSLNNRSFPNHVYAVNAWDVDRAQTVSQTLVNYSRIGYKYKGQKDQTKWDVREHVAAGVSNMKRAVGLRINEPMTEANLPAEDPAFLTLTPDERKDEKKFVNEMLSWGNRETYDSVFLHNKIEHLKNIWFKNAKALGEIFTQGRENKQCSVDLIFEKMESILGKKFAGALKKSFQKELQELFNKKNGRDLTTADLLTLTEKFLIKSKCADIQTTLDLAGYYAERFDAWREDKGNVLSQDKNPENEEEYLLFDWKEGGQVSVRKEKKIAHEVLKDLETKTLLTALKPFEAHLAKDIDAAGEAQLDHFHGNNYNAGFNAKLPKEDARLWTTLFCLKWMGDKPTLNNVPLKVPGYMSGPCGALQQPAWLLGGALTAVRYVTGKAHMFDSHCRDHQDVEEGTYMFAPKGTALYDHLEKNNLRNEHLAPTIDNPDNRVIPEKVTRPNPLTLEAEEGLVIPVDCVHTQAFAYIEGTESEMARNLRRLWSYKSEAEVKIAGIACNQSGEDDPYVFGGDGKHLMCETKDANGAVPLKISSKEREGAHAQQALIVEALELYKKDITGEKKLVGGFTQNHDDAAHPKKDSKEITNETQPCQNEAENCEAGNRDLYLGIFRKELGLEEHDDHAEHHHAAHHHGAEDVHAVATPEELAANKKTKEIDQFSERLSDQFKEIALTYRFVISQHFNHNKKEERKIFNERLLAVEDSSPRKALPLILNRVLQQARTRDGLLTVLGVFKQDIKSLLESAVYTPEQISHYLTDVMGEINTLLIAKEAANTIKTLQDSGFTTNQLIESLAQQSKELIQSKEITDTVPQRDTIWFAKVSNLLKVGLNTQEVDPFAALYEHLKNDNVLPEKSLTKVSHELLKIKQHVHADKLVPAVSAEEAEVSEVSEVIEEPIPQNRRDPARGWQNNKSSFMVPPMIKGVVSSSTFLGGASYLASAIAGASQAVLWFGTAASGVSAGLAGLLGWIGVEKIRDAAHSDRRLNQVEKKLNTDQARLANVANVAKTEYQTALDALQTLTNIGTPQQTRRQGALPVATLSDLDAITPLNTLNRVFEALNEANPLIVFLEANKAVLGKEQDFLLKDRQGSKRLVLTSFNHIITHADDKKIDLLMPAQLYDKLKNCEAVLNRLGQVVAERQAKQVLTELTTLVRPMLKSVEKLVYLHEAAQTTAKHLESVENHQISIAKEREENQFSRKAATGYIGSAGMLGAGSGLGIASHFVSAGSALASGFAMASSWAGGVGLVALSASYGVNWRNKSKEYNRLSNVMRVVQAADPNVNEPFLPTVVGQHHGFLQHVNNRMDQVRRERNLWRSGTIALGALGAAGIAAAGVASFGIIPAVALVAFAVVTLVGSVPLLTNTFQLFNRYANWGGQYQRRNEDSIDVDDTLLDSAEDRKKIFWVKNGGMFNLINEKVMELAQIIGDEERLQGKEKNHVDILHNRKPLPQRTQPLLTLYRQESRKEVFENIKARARWIQDQAFNPNVGQAILAKNLALKIEKSGQAGEIDTAVGRTLTGAFNDYFTHRLNFLQHRKQRLEGILKSLEVSFKTGEAPSVEQIAYFDQIKTKYASSEHQCKGLNRYLDDLSKFQTKTTSVTKMSEEDNKTWQALQLRFMALTGASQHMFTRKEQKQIARLTGEGQPLHGIMSVTSYRAGFTDHIAECKVLDDVKFAKAVLEDVNDGGNLLRTMLSAAKREDRNKPSKLSKRFADYFVSVLPNIEFGDLISMFERYELNNRTKPEANVNNSGKPYLAAA